MEGIALLQRSSPGWELVGEASPESPTLGQEMKALREAAEKLAPGQATFKIVIPNEQIRYVTVPAGRADPVSRQQTVAMALDGQTPYSLDELATDSAVSGQHLHIAAVALETLQEADEFARGFGFTPVSFAAMPEPRDYSGEPFFGTAHDVPANITVEPDTVAIRVIGRVKSPTAPPAPDPAKEEDAPVAFVSRRSKEPEGEDTPAPADAPAAAKPAAKSDPKSDAAVASASSAKASAPRGAELRASRKASWERDAAKKAKADTAVEDDASAADTGAALTPPSTDFETAFDATDATPSPRRPNPLAGVTGVLGGIGTTLGGALSSFGKKRAARASEVPELVLPDSAGISLDGSTPAPSAEVDDPVNEPVEPSIAEASEETSKPAKTSRWKRSKKAAAAPIVTDAAVAEDTVAPDLEAEASSQGQARSLGELSAEERRKEAERLTVFGARGGAAYEPSGGGARVAIAVVGVVALLGTAGWAAIFMNDGMAPLVSPQAGVEEREPAEEVAGAAVTEESVPPGPGDDEAIEDVSPLIVTEAVEAAEETAPEETANADTTDVPADGPEAEARYAATGIWQDSPDPLASETLGADDAARDDNPGSDGPPQRMEQPALAALVPDALPTPPGPPPTPGQRFNMDDRGLVIATPEGAVTPQGVVVYAGDPPLLPPTRPGEPEQTQDDAALQPEATPDVTPEATPEDEAEVTVIAGLPPILPPARPGVTEGVAEETAPVTEPVTELAVDTAEATPELTEDTAVEAEVETVAARPEPRFEALRPLIRPFAADPDPAPIQVAAATTTGPAQGASLASGAIESAVAAALNDEGVTRTSAAAGLVIAPQPTPEPQLEPAFTALRPLKRPENMPQLAAAARVTQAPPPAVVPRVPSSASVTRQATVRNAINLNRINLIGVYGQPSDRRALVRLANGRYRKVQVGDRIDGGRVLAIGDGTLRYQKNGRNVTLDMPSG